ncbi:MAG: hypothetical protein E6Y08_07230 [Paenibacillus sp.]|uniref:hypothetical protein n=1 Tax=Paenibacillus sp. TaxID=58172 RepID=UPI00290D4194|nr:hypothetical protein [Paenibacillus sp.]MDU4695591.1 hypothetical protein [Paenibacillus sp.]
MIDYIKNNEQLLAIIVNNRDELHSKEGVTFLTPPELFQQVAYMNHAKGKVIEPHDHNHIKREVTATQEVLIIQKGKLRVDFYTDEREYLESRILEAGDIILLAHGGHGFEVIEDLGMIEVKQGPYAGELDKTRFDGVSHKQIKVSGQYE